MHVTQCVHLGATLDLRFMVDFQPEEALEPRVLYMVAEQVSDASRCAQFLLDRVLQQEIRSDLDTLKEALKRAAHRSTGKPNRTRADTVSRS
jgi:hypothetical protein